MTDAAASFAGELRRLRTARGLSYRALAELATQGKSLIEDLEKGRRRPNPSVAANLDKALAMGGRLAAILQPPTDDDVEGELEAMELVRRVTASDVSTETIERLERAADKMAMAYAITSSDQLRGLLRLREAVARRGAGSVRRARADHDHLGLRPASSSAVWSTEDVEA